MTRPNTDPTNPYRAGQTNTNGTIICGAKNRNGQPCGKYPAKGATRCVRHGGGSPKSKAAAARRNTTNQAHAELRALGFDPDAENIDPAEALLRLVSDKAREVAWLRHMVDQVGAGQHPETDPMSSPLVWGVTSHQTGVGPLGAVDVETRGPDINVWVRWMHTAEDQLARYAAAALKAGVQRRQVELQEALALQFVGAIHQILGGLQLTATQQETAGTLVPSVLRSLDQKETP